MKPNRIPRSMQSAALLLLLVLAAVAGRWAARLAQPSAPPGNWPDPAAMAALTPYVEPVAGPVSAYEALDSRQSERDPFSVVPLYVTEPDGAPTVAAPEPRWVASAILITRDRRSAVVDDQIVSVGDVVRGGARVVSIEWDHVEIVTPSGARRTLRVQPGGPQ